MDSGGEQCLLSLSHQNAIQREFEFRILKVAAFNATIAIAAPWYSQRNAILIGISRGIVGNQPTIQGDQCQHIKIIATLPPSPTFASSAGMKHVHRRASIERIGCLGRVGGFHLNPDHPQADVYSNVIRHAL